MQFLFDLIIGQQGSGTLTGKNRDGLADKGFETGFAEISSYSGILLLIGPSFVYGGR